MREIPTEETVRMEHLSGLEQIIHSFRQKIDPNNTGLRSNLLRKIRIKSDMILEAYIDHFKDCTFKPKINQNS
jgi:hypothetical protein